MASSQTAAAHAAAAACLRLHNALRPPTLRALASPRPMRLHDAARAVLQTGALSNVADGPLLAPPGAHLSPDSASMRLLEGAH